MCRGFAPLDPGFGSAGEAIKAGRGPASVHGAAARASASPPNDEETRKFDHDRLGHLLCDRQHDMLVADQITTEKPPA
jgi:hypothetical protein